MELRPSNCSLLSSIASSTKGIFAFNAKWTGAMNGKVKDCQLIRVSTVTFRVSRSGSAAESLFREIFIVIATLKEPKSDRKSALQSYFN
jgi:hypothetical protein